MPRADVVRLLTHAGCGRVPSGGRRVAQGEGLESYRRESEKMPNSLESLEKRSLFSAAYPSNLEQYMVELINRARANPAAEASRFGVDLNEGLAGGAISTAAKQPLAINPTIVDAARKHSQWMIDTDQFDHTGSGGSDPQQRMKAAGYAFNAPWSWSENIALRSYNTSAPDAGVIDAIEKDLFVDIGIVGRGHRVNLLDGSVNEVGVGMATGEFSYFNAAMTTQNFASSGGATFLTGVVYDDAKVSKNQFYTPGEGLGSVTITAVRSGDGATFTAASWSSGGYSLKLGAGTYKVTASGGSLGKTITYDAVTIGQTNVKRDFVIAGGSVQNPPTPPESKPVTPTTPSAPTDKTAPTVSTVRSLRKRQASRYYRFSVTYQDSVGISGASLGAGDVLVRGAGGYERTAILVSVDQAGNGKTRTVTYEVKGPRGEWTRSRNGVYTIWSAAGQVKDTSNNALPSQQIGSFTVRIARGLASVPGVKKALAVEDVLGSEA